MLRSKRVVPVFKVLHAACISSVTHGAHKLPMPPGSEDMPASSSGSGPIPKETFCIDNSRRTHAAYQAPTFEKSHGDLAPLSAAKHNTTAGQDGGSRSGPDSHVLGSPRDRLRPSTSGSRRRFHPLSQGSLSSSLVGEGPCEEGQTAPRPELPGPIPKQKLRCRSTARLLAATGTVYYSTVPTRLEASTQAQQITVLSTPPRAAASAPPLGGAAGGESASAFQLAAAPEGPAPSPPPPPVGKSHVPDAGRQGRRPQGRRPAASCQVAARARSSGGRAVHGPRSMQAHPNSRLPPRPQVEENSTGATWQRPVGERSVLPGTGLDLGGSEQEEELRQNQQPPPLRPGVGTLREDVCQVLRQVSGAEAARLQRDVGKALQPWQGLLTTDDVCYVLKQQRNKPHVAMGLFEWVKRQPDYRPDLYVYITLMSVLGGAGEMDLVGRTYGEMKAAGCNPTISTFNCLLHVYGSNNMLTKVLSLEAELLEAGLVPDRITYNTLCGIWSKAGRHDRVIQVFGAMRAAKVEPDAVGYNLLITTYKRLGQLREALRLYGRMRAEGVKPRNHHLYNTLIDLHVKAGLAARALALFHEMRADGVVPDMQTYNTVLDLYSRVGLYKEAEELFAKLEAPDEIMWSTLINMWARYGDATRAALYFSLMRQAGVRAGDASCRPLLFAYLSTGMFREAKAAFDEMRRGGYVPSLATYTMLLTHSSTSTDQADASVLAEMMEAAEHPLHALLSRLLREPAGDDEAEGALEAAVARGVAALRLRDGAGFKQGPEAFIDAVISALHKHGREARAAMVWAQARRSSLYSRALTPGRAPQGRWQLNLHGMSPGTAAIVTRAELRELRRLALGGGPRPRTAEIVTGWGRRSRVQGQSLVKQEVVRLLEGLGSPFREDDLNMGVLRAPVGELWDWLRQPHVERGLALRDAPSG